MRHLNNGTDHRHSKSCCDQSSPARRTITKQMKLSGSYRGCTNYTNTSKYPISEISPISINGRFNDKCRKYNMFAWLVTESQPSLIRFNCRHVIVETHVCMHIILSTSSVRWWNVLLMGGHLDAVIEAEKKVTAAIQMTLIWTSTAAVESTARQHCKHPLYDVH